MELTTIDEMAEILVSIYDATGTEWTDYGPPNKEDAAVALAGMADYLEGVDGPANLELPNARLSLSRDEDGVHTVWFRVGRVDIDSVPDES